MSALVVLFLACAVGEPSSPRLSELAKNPQALAAFWQERAGRGPLVEELSDDPDHLLVTFLWRGDAATRRVEVRGGPVEIARTGFEQAPGTDVWHLSVPLPRDSRLLYNFVVQSAATVDGTERLLHLLQCLPHRARVRRVRWNGHRVAAQEPDEVVQAHRIDVHQRYLRAILEKAAHDRERHVSRSRGDDDGLPLENHQRVTICMPFTFSCASIIEARRRSPSPSDTAWLNDWCTASPTKVATGSDSARCV